MSIKWGGERSTKLPKAITSEEFKKLLKATKKKHHKLAFVLGFMSGLRVSEVVNLRPDHIDYERKQMRIYDSKWGKDRIVPIPKSMPREYFNHLPLECGARALQLAFRRNLKKAGLNRPELSFHSLRHGFAIRAMDKGVPLNQIQILLGHSSIQTTAVYLKANPAVALQAYEDLF